MPRFDAPASTLKVISPLSPYWSEGGITLYHGDVIEVLNRLPVKSVHCAISSPPYWALRDYGTAEWEGGSKDCDHKSPGTNRGERTELPNPQEGWATRAQEHKYLSQCGKCGARRIDRQIGSEASPDLFVQKMVDVFAAVHRVLRDDGTLWLNLGDTYAAGNNRNGMTGTMGGDGRKPNNPQIGEFSTNLPSGNLVGIPWRVALALQAWGWVLRSDIPWVKRSSMPESATNRPAKSLEYVFLLTKRGSDYYFDMEAIRRRGTSPISTGGGRNPRQGVDVNGGNQAFEKGIPNLNPDGRNFRNADLWFDSIKPPHGLVGVDDELVGLDVTSQAYKGAHFATFPAKLVEPFIKAGTSAKGVCGKCGAPWKRVVELTKEYQALPLASNAWDDDSGKPDEGKLVNRQHKGHPSQVPTKNRTLGWSPSCSCNASVIPATLLDPFAGTMTVGCFGAIYGRHSIGIELSEVYLRENSVPRCRDYLRQAEKNRARGFTPGG